MATIKSYTDIEQSRKLAEILPLESADMCYLPTHIGDEHHFIASLSSYSMCTKLTEVSIEYCTPCWSLATLLDVLPDELEDNHFLTLYKEGKEYCCCYEDGNGNSFKHKFADNPIDACVAMIEHLHELKIL